MKKLSNDSTRHKKIIPYAFAIPILGFVIYGAFGVFRYPELKDVIIYLLLAISGITILGYAIEFGIKLKEAYLDGEYLHMKGFFKEDRVSLSNITIIKTYNLILFKPTEWPFRVRFKNPTKFGREIIIHPTNLSDDKKFKLNLGIQKTLKEAVRNEQTKYK